MNRIILILIFSATLSTVFGQERYRGEYKFNGLEGRGDFLYDLGENNRAILNGEFSFSRNVTDSVDKRKLYKLEIKGEYDKNVKINEWTYLDQIHTIHFEDVVNFEPKIELKSSSVKLNSIYKEGKPDGIWKIEEQDFFNNELRLVFESEDLKFKNGNINGELHFKEFQNNEIYYIKGQTDEEGLMTGNWDFYYLEGDNKIKETRRYEAGFLIGINKINTDTDESIQEVIYYNTINKLQQLEGNDDLEFKISDKLFNLTFNDGFRDLSSEFAGQTYGNDLLKKYLKKVLKYDTGYVSKSYELIAFPIHTKRFEYEISEDQLELIINLEKDFNKLENDVNTFANRNSLELNRSKSDSLAFIYSFFQYNQFKVSQIKEVIQVFTSDDINFIDLTNFSRDGFSFLSAVDVITYEFGDKSLSKEIIYSSLIDINKNVLKLFQDYITEMQSFVSEYGGYASSQLSRYEQTEELESLESEILNKKTKIEEKYKSFVSESSQVEAGLAKLKSNILNDNFNVLNSTYAETESFNTRIEIGNNILRLLDVSEFVLDSLPQTYTAYNELKEFYTDVTLDPFSFETNFKVLRKRRMIEAGEFVFDYYLRKIEQEKDYSKIQNYFIQINNLLFRLRELRTENTSRLERRLSGLTDVEQIKRLLEL